jgi:hypothetical protein
LSGASCLTTSSGAGLSGAQRVHCVRRTRCALQFSNKRTLNSVGQSLTVGILYVDGACVISRPAWLKWATLNEMPNFTGVMAMPFLSTGLCALKVCVAARCG